MTKQFIRSLSLMASLFVLVATASAQTITPVGTDGVFGCSDDGTSTTLIKTKDGLNTPVSFGKTIKRTRRNIRRSRRARRAAQLAGKSKRVERLEAKIDRLVSRLADILVCRDGAGTPGSGGGGSTGGGGGEGGEGGGEGGEGGGGGEETVVACDVVGDQSGTNQASEKIINGSVCTVGNSYTVELSLSNGVSGFLCSGTVVTSRAIITAAHCLDGMTTVSAETPDGSKTASSFAAHPGWTGSNSPLEKNDIGVVVFSDDLPTAIAPVHGTGEYTVGETTVIGGYGLNENGQLGTLRAATALLAASTSASVTITYSGNDEHGNTCSGDSGGPLFIKRNDVWKLAAVTSNGVNANCGNGDISNFANLEDPSNQSFIEQHIPGLFD